MDLGEAAVAVSQPTGSRQTESLPSPFVRAPEIKSRRSPLGTSLPCGPIAGEIADGHFAAVCWPHRHNCRQELLFARELKFCKPGEVAVILLSGVP